MEAAEKASSSWGMAGEDTWFWEKIIDTDKQIQDISIKEA
jgi:hypothetical protein